MRTYKQHVVHFTHFLLKLDKFRYYLVTAAYLLNVFSESIRVESFGGSKDIGVHALSRLWC